MLYPTELRAQFEADRVSTAFPSGAIGLIFAWFQIAGKQVRKS